MNILENQGVLQVVIEEYTKHKLPHLILINERVQGGGELYDEELSFMNGLYTEINRYGLFIEESTELMALYVSFASLFHSIMDSAIENEQRLNLGAIEQ